MTSQLSAKITLWCSSLLVPAFLAVTVSLVKTVMAGAVRFSTMDAICQALQCQPGDLFEFIDNGEGEDGL